MRLSSVLAEKASLFLLDEPTNHLDSDSLEELIRIIKNEKSTYIIVSHDRYFIDEVADVVFEIEYGKLSVYEGNYTDRSTSRRRYEIAKFSFTNMNSNNEKSRGWKGKLMSLKTGRQKRMLNQKKGRRSNGAKEYFRMKAKKKDVQIRSKRKT